MDITHLRRRCEARLRMLDLPTPFDISSFCDTLAGRRGRPIRLQAIASGTGPFGLWVVSLSADYIFYEQETSVLHQEHIVLHELCHLLCDHHPVPVSSGDLSRLLFPHLEPTTIQRVLERAAYSTDEECEAELLASLILRQARPGDVAVTSTPDTTESNLLARLEASLEEGARGVA